MSRRTPLLLLAVMALAAVGLWLFAVRIQLKVTLEGVQGEPAARMWIDGEAAPRPVTVSDCPARNQLRIVHEGPPVALLAATTGQGGRVPLEDFTPAGDWTREGERLVSRAPGSTLLWNGVTSGLRVTFVGGPPGGHLRLAWNGVEQEADFSATPAEIVLPSTCRQLSAHLPVTTGRVRIDVQGARATGARLSLHFGNRRLSAGEIPPEGAEWEVNQAGAVAAVLVGNGLRLIGLGLILLLAYWVLGLGVVRPLFDRLSPVERWWIPPLVGLELSALGTTSLSYVLPGRWGFPIVAGTLIGVTLITGRAQWRRLPRQMALARPEWAFPTLVALLSLATFFLPAWIDGPWFLGHACMDTTFYTNMAAAFRGQRPFEMVNPLELARLSDFVSLSNSSMLLGENPRAIFALSCASLWALLPFIGWSLLERMGSPETGRRIGTVLIGCSAGLYGVFSQDYLSQYLFCIAIVFSMYSMILGEALRAELSGKTLWTLRVVIATGIAFALSVYPFQFLLPLAWAGAMLVTGARGDFRRRLIEVSAVAVLSLLLLNINVRPILLFPEMRKYYGNFAVLNGIARWLVFPFWNSWEFLPIALGLRDFILSSKLFPEAYVEVLATRSAVIPAHVKEFVDLVGTLAAGVAWISGAIVLAGTGALLTRRSVAHRTWGLTLILCLGLTGWLSASGEIYAYGKLVMTLGTLCVPTLAWALARWGFGEGRWGSLRGAAATAVAIAFVALNLLSGGFENLDSFVSRDSPLVFRFRSHVGVLDDEVRAFSEGVESSPELLAASSKMVFQCRDQDRMGTDRDRVMDRHLLLLALRGRSLEHPAGRPEQALLIRHRDAACTAPAPQSKPVVSTQRFDAFLVDAPPGPPPMPRLTWF